MITVKIAGDKLAMDGHAGFAPEGQDIVCAAASILAYSLVRRLDDMGRLGSRNLEPGLVRIAWDGSTQAREAVAFAETGFRMLADLYPANISLTYL